MPADDRHRLPIGSFLAAAVLLFPRSLTVSRSCYEPRTASYALVRPVWNVGCGGGSGRIPAERARRTCHGPGGSLCGQGVRWIGGFLQPGRPCISGPDFRVRRRDGGDPDRFVLRPSAEQYQREDTGAKPVLLTNQCVRHLPGLRAPACGDRCEQSVRTR